MISQSNAISILSYLKELHLHDDVPKPPVCGLYFISDEELMKLGIKPSELDDHYNGGGMKAPAYFSEGTEYHEGTIKGVAIIKDRLERYCANPYMAKEQARKEEQGKVEVGG